MKRILLALSLCLITAITPIIAQDHTNTCTADTELNSGWWSTNGSASVMYSYGDKTHSAEQRDLTLTFDIHSIPGDTIVTRADLRMYCIDEGKGDASQGMTLEVRGVTKPWLESEATWTQANAADGNWGGSASFADPSNWDAANSGSLTNEGAESWIGQWKTIDVTPLVALWHAGRPNYGLTVQQWARDSAGDAASLERLDWSSREGTFAPHILVWTEVNTEPAPAAPSGLTATAESATVINLTWSDNSSNETLFVLERSTSSGGPWDATNSVAAGVTNFTDASCSAATTYYYRLRAQNAGGVSAYTAEASDTTWLAPFVATLLQDSYVQIYEGVPIVSPNRGNETFMTIDGYDTRPLSGDIKNALIQFDLAGAPAGTVDSAVLRLACTREDAAATEQAEVTIHALLMPWTEADVNFSNRTASADWTGGNFEPGANTHFDATPSVTKIALTSDNWAGSTVEFDITGLVSEWKLGIRDNYGVVIMSDGHAGQGGKRIDFDTQEGSIPPVLHVYISAGVATPPAAPANLTAAVVSATQVDLEWTDMSTNESGFNVERRLTSGGSWTSLGGVAEGVTNYSDTQASPDTGYDYRVNAQNSGGISAYSGIASVTTWVAPTVAGIIKDTYLVLDSAGATNLTLNADGTDTELISDGSSTHASNGDIKDALIKFDISSAPTGIVERAVLRIFCTEERYGAGHATPKNARIDVHAVNSDWSEAQAIWTDSASGTAWQNGNFEAGGNYAPEVADTITSTTADNLSGTFIEFDIAALATEWITGVRENHGIALLSYNLDSAGNGARFKYMSSEGVTAPSLQIYMSSSADLSAPLAPSGLAATTISSTRIDLSWTDGSTNETGFSIERKIESGGTYVAIDGVSAGIEFFSDLTAAPATEYFYRVRAMGVASNSAYSSEASATTWPAPTILDVNADTYIDESFGANNYGAEITMLVDGTKDGGAEQRHALLNFNLTGATAGTVDRALLRLYCTGETHLELGGNVLVHGMLTDWAENEVTWYTNSTDGAGWTAGTLGPASGQDYDTSPIENVTALAPMGGLVSAVAPTNEDWSASWVEIDITPLAGLWINSGRSQLGLIISGFSTDGGTKKFTFATTEGAEATRPQLHIYGAGGLEIGAVEMGDVGNGDLSWPSTPGTDYALQFTADLINTNWITLATTNASSTTVELSDPTPDLQNVGNRYYRILLP